MQYVESHGWDHAGAGDWNVRLERYLLCADGKYHAVDFFDRRQHVTVTPIYVSAPCCTLLLQAWVIAMCSCCMHNICSSACHAPVSSPSLLAYQQVQSRAAHSLQPDQG